MSTKKYSAVRQSSFEHRYQFLVESIKDYAIYMLTPQGIVDSWNAGAQHFKGYTAEEIIGRSFAQFYTPEDQAANRPAVALHTAATEGKFETEGWRVRKDGSRFWAHVIIDPVWGESGKLVGFAKITRDITDKKAAQDALRESEQRFRILVKGVTDYAIYMLSPDGIITNWNAGAERIKGYLDHEVIGTHFSRFYTDEDKARQLPAVALATAIREGKFEGEGWRVRKDGSRFWAHVVIDTVYDDQGNRIGFAKITRDITEKRDAEQVLEEARAALVQSQKMEAIGRLTGGIAHDFNNLLAGILGNLDLMRVRIALGQTSEIGRHLDAAIAATKRSAALTHRLLAFARRQTLAPKPVDVTWLVNSMMDMLLRTVGPDVEIETDTQQGLWWTLCDQNQLENSLLNLVINARDAMPDGGKLTIRTQNVSMEQAVGLLGVNLKPGDYVVLSVTDSGTGMTPDVIEHAFEPFFTTKPFGEGTGLGLAMIHGFANQSGGCVTIDSEVGRGTTISLYLPKHVAGQDAMPESTVQSEGLLPAANRQNLTVLVVDDELPVRTMLVEMLRQFGHDPLEAADGYDGLQMLETHPRIGLLITDIGLPGGMNGRQLSNLARVLRPDLKILFITGYAEQSVIGKDTLPPGMQILTKPFTMETLDNAVRSMIDSPRIDPV